MKQLLSSSAFIVLNKELAKKIGINAAVMLADLISKEEYFINNGMTDGWFFNTEANIEQDTTLNPYMQRKCLKTLKSENLVEVKRKGIPAKQYFKINEQQVIQILNNLSVKNYTTINKNKEIKLNNKYFKKPTILEVKVYCKERNNNIDSEAFIAFYESKGWMIGKNKMKDWKQAIITWEKRSKNKSKGMSKIHQHLQKNINVKEKLKKQFNQ